MSKLKMDVVQIVLRDEDQNLYAVVLEQDRMNLLLGFIEAASEGTVKVVPLPHAKMVSPKDLDPSA